MKYEAPEIRIEIFDAEDIVVTSGIEHVQNELTSGSGKIKLDSKSNISEANIFSFEF